MESPLDVVLLLDGICMPTSLEWASHQGCDDLISFLLEADSFRYKIADTDTLRHLNRLLATYLSSDTQSPVLKLLSPAAINMVMKVINCNIPLKCAMSGICEHVWGEILNKFSSLPFSPEWPSFRQIILNDVKLDFTSFIVDASLRRYLEEYLVDTPEELNALCCWRDAREVIMAFEKYKVEPFSSRSRGASNASSASSIARSNSYNNLGMASPTSSRLTAANTAKLGSIRRPATYVYPSGSYDDDVGALKLLLARCHALRKRYFGSAGSRVLGLTESTRLSILAAVDSVLSNKANANYAATVDMDNIPPAYLASLISTLDQMFIRKTVTTLEQLLHLLEKEIVGYIKVNCLASFQGSVLFVEMVAEFRGKTSNSVSRYVKQKNVLEKVKRLHNQQELRRLQRLSARQDDPATCDRGSESTGTPSLPPATPTSQNIMDSTILHWNDADASGSVYISYNDRIGREDAEQVAPGVNPCTGTRAEGRGLQETAMEAGIVVLCVQGAYESLALPSSCGEVEVLGAWGNCACYGSDRSVANRLNCDTQDPGGKASDTTVASSCTGSSSSDTASFAYFSGCSSLISGAALSSGVGPAVCEPIDLPMSNADSDWRSIHEVGSVDTMSTTVGTAPPDAASLTGTARQQEALAEGGAGIAEGLNSVCGPRTDTHTPASAAVAEDPIGAESDQPLCQPASPTSTFYSAATQAINASFSYFRSPEVSSTRPRTGSDSGSAQAEETVEDVCTALPEEEEEGDSDSDSYSGSDSGGPHAELERRLTELQLERRAEVEVEADGPRRRMSYRTVSSISSDQLAAAAWRSPNSSTYSRSHSTHEVSQLQLGAGSLLSEFGVRRPGIARSGGGSQNVLAGAYGRSASRIEELSALSVETMYRQCCSRRSANGTVSVSQSETQQQLWLSAILGDILTAVGPVTEESLPNTASLLISSERVVDFLIGLFPALMNIGSDYEASGERWNNILVTVHFLRGSSSSKFCCSMGFTTMPSLVSTMRGVSELALQYAVLYQGFRGSLTVLPSLLVQIPIRLNAWNRHILSASGSQEHGTDAFPLCCGDTESITDLYLGGGYFPPPADDFEDVATLAEGHNVAAADELLAGPTDAAPASRFFGEFDLSLADLVHTLGLPLLTKLVLLVLMDRSVLLLAHSQTLVTVVMNALPRLIYPFRLLHVFSQCHTTEQLQAAVAQAAGQGLGDTGTSTHTSAGAGTCSPHDVSMNSRHGPVVAQVLREHVGSPSSEIAQSDSSRASSPSILSQASTHSAQSLHYLKPPARTTGGSVGSDSDASAGALSHSCPSSYIIGTTTSIFNRVYAAPEASAGEGDLSHQQLISNWIMLGSTGGNFGCICDLDTGKIEVSTKDMLILERSFYHVDALEKEILRGLWSPQLPQSGGSCRAPARRGVTGAVTASGTDCLRSITNCRIERAFYKFLFDLLLRYLPENLVHFPRERIIGCNIDKLLTNILIDNNSVNKSMFLAVVESKSFLDLVKRHGVALE